MLISGRKSRRRRGTMMVESAITFVIVMMLTLGTISVGLGVIQYQELGWLAQEGARWAAVHGPTYQAEQSSSEATSQLVMTNVITPKIGILSSNNLTCTVTMTNGVATVKLSYAWSPPAFLNPITLQSSSSIPITY
jgi:Flp pilus assembly protein TadG